MDSFYITLPSNVVSDSFDNTVANFKTKLVSRINVKGQWEVALVDASYTYSWYNIPHEETIKLKYFDDVKGEIRNLSVEMKVVPSRYDNIDELLKHINDSMKIIFKNKGLPLPDFRCNHQLRRVYIDRSYYNNRIIFPKLSSGLCRLFGINKVEMDKEAKTKLLAYKKNYDDAPADIRKIFRPDLAPTEDELRFWSVKPFDFAFGLHSLYVYSDIVKHNFVGDSFTQLLRIVEVPPNTKYGDQVVLTYNNPHYIPIITNEFETIEIDIKDDTGERVPFQFGRSIFVLHFRKIQ